MTLPSATRQLAGTVLTAALLVLGAPAAPSVATVAAATTVLASGPGAFPARLDVVGADATRVVVATEHQAGQGRQCCFIDRYSTVAAGGGSLASIGGVGASLPGGSVAGSTLVDFFDLTKPYWIDVDTGHSGPGRSAAGGPGSTWQTAVPGGGAWVSGGGAPRQLLTTAVGAPDARPTVLATLPGFTGATAVAAAADTHGIAAVAGSTLDYYSFAGHTARTLDTAGVTGLTCTSVTAVAVGCRTAAEVLRVPTDGSAPTVIAAAGVGRVVVGPTATAWIVAATGQLVTRTGTVSSFSPFAVSGVAAVADDFVYSRVDARAGGIYRLTGGAASGGRLLVRAPALPRLTFDVALTAGRASWIDDSAVTYPVLSRRLLRRGSGPVTLGPTVLTSAASAAYPTTATSIDTPVSGLAISGTRSLFVSGGRLTSTGVVGSAVLVDAGGHHVLGSAADGAVALSGGRALWQTPTGHLLLRDLTTGRTRDLTAVTGGGLVGRTGDLTGVLYGRYLAYARGGFVQRLDLDTGRHLRVGRAAANALVGPVRTAGDWVAWQIGTGRGSRIFARNARTMAPAVASPAGRTLETVSPAGFASSTAAGQQLFRRWGSATDHSLPAVDRFLVGRQRIVAADDGLATWIAPDGYPAVEAYAASAARPQALGSPFAAARVAAGHRWTFDQPMSEVLMSCRVVLRRGSRVVARLRCAATAAQQGEAVAVWNGRVGGRAAPAGRYTWQVVAANTLGPVLAGTGVPGAPVRGIVVVVR